MSGPPVAASAPAAAPTAAPVPSPVTPLASPPPVARPAPPSTPPPVAPREPEVRDVGGTRHDSVRAQRWTADGAVKVLGDVDVGDAALVGAISVRGSLTADRLTVNGSIEVSGPVSVGQRLQVGGSARFGGAVGAGDLELQGGCDANGGVTVKGNLGWSGHLEVRGDVTAPSVRFDGCLTTSGDLVAKSIDGRLRDLSHARAIHADSIRLTRHSAFLGKKGSLSVLRIEATEVALEGVKCQYLKAARVTLGPDCHIAFVEGTVVRQHPSSHVGPESASPKPHGLTR